MPHRGSPTHHNFVAGAKAVVQRELHVGKRAQQLRVKGQESCWPVNILAGFADSVHHRVSRKQLRNGVTLFLIPHFLEPAPPQSHVFIRHLALRSNDWVPAASLYQTDMCAASANSSQSREFGLSGI